MPGFAGALLLCALLIMQPALCRALAQEALKDWALTVAPTLLPFFMAIPRLTGPEAREVYRSVLGWLPALFGLPGDAAGTIVIGMLAGSPAGASAQLQTQCPLTRGQALRLSVLCSGAGPVFYLSFVGDALLHSPASGRMLCLCQWAASALAALLLWAVDRDPRPALSSGVDGSGSDPIAQILHVGGCMVFFGILGGAMGARLGPDFHAPLMALMELGGGARALVAAGLPESFRLPLLGAACCFGGASICAQSLAHLRRIGIGTGEYLAGKWLQTLLDALLILTVCS